MRKLESDSCKKPGRPKKTWTELILNDKRQLNMVCVDPLDHSEWKGQPLVKGKRVIKRI